MPRDYIEKPRHFRIANRSDLVNVLIAANLPVPELRQMDDDEYYGFVVLGRRNGRVTERVDVSVFRDVDPDSGEDKGLIANINLMGSPKRVLANQTRLDKYFETGDLVRDKTRRLRKRGTVELFDRGTKFSNPRRKWAGEP
jgi:hypothetical protein